MMKMKIEGAAEFAKALRQISPGQERGLQNKMLLKAAEPIRARMAQLAPRDEARPPHLADHILARPIGASQIQDVNLLGTRQREASEAIVAIGPQKGFAVAGFQQEFGNQNHPAQPFARPAFDEKGPHAVSIYAAEMWAWMRGRAARVFSLSGRHL